MASDELVVNIDSPQIDAPVLVDVNVAGLVSDITSSINKLVDDIKSGSDEAITAIFLAGMFIFAGVILWRQV